MWLDALCIVVLVTSHCTAGESMTIVALDNPATMCEPVKIANSSPAQGLLHVSFDKFQGANPEVLRPVAHRLFNPHRPL
jgi:hypothetical protein